LKRGISLKPKRYGTSPESVFGKRERGKKRNTKKRMKPQRRGTFAPLSFLGIKKGKRKKKKQREEEGTGLCVLYFWEEGVS